MALTPKTQALIVPLATKLAELAATHPELAEMVVTIMVKGVERAMRQGPLNPSVWMRSFEGAARQFGNRKFAKEWTQAVTLRTRSIAERFRKTKADVERAR